MTGQPLRDEREPGPRPAGAPWGPGQAVEHPTLSVVVPACNEEAVLPAAYLRLTGVLREIGLPYEIVFVDDGSQDCTLDMILAMAEQDECVRALSFSRNFGHQAAITAGMEAAQGDAVVVIDADLQDPPELIGEFVRRWRQGCDVVYGRRVERRGEGAWKRWTAAVFYRVLSRLAGVPLPVDAGDFRLLDRQVCDALRALPEQRRYVRGLVAWLGFRQGEVPYVREPRAAGATKYSLVKMLRLAGDGLMTFPRAPLRLALGAGAALNLAALAVLLALALRPATAAPWLFEGAVALLSGLGAFAALALLGALAARIYDEVRGRPLYVLRRTRPGTRP